MDAQNIGLARPRPKAADILGRIAYQNKLAFRSKPADHLLRRRDRHLADIHCAHTHKEKGRTKALPRHFSVQRIGALLNAYAAQPSRQILIRHFVIFHGLDEQQRGHLLPTFRYLRLTHPSAHWIHSRVLHAPYPFLYPFVAIIGKPVIFDRMIKFSSLSSLYRFEFF